MTTEIELKTLKDFKSYNVIPNPHASIRDDESSDFKWITDIDLKQEAIKWRKDCGNDEIQWFIDEFFNLTEEDINGS